MQNDSETAVIDRAPDETKGNMDALGRLLKRRPSRTTNHELLDVGETGDGADVDADEVEIAGQGD